MYFTLLYRLGGSTGYLLWFTDEDDGIVTTPDGRIPSFPTSRALFNYATAQGFTVEGEETSLHDLDAIQAWVNAPKPLPLDCSEILSAWNLFGDVARSVPSDSCAFTSMDASLGASYEKLFWGNNLPAVTPAAQRFDPEWSLDEVRCLSELMQCGLEMFRGSMVDASRQGSW